MLAIKKIKTEKNHYIYDTYRNKLIKVDEKLYNTLDENMSFEQLTSEMDECYIEDIKHYRKKNFFQDFPLEIEEFDYLVDIDKDYKKLNMLSLEITEQCNFRCKYCVYGDSYANLKFRNHNDNMMDYSTAKKAVDFYIQNCHKAEPVVRFYGGEPLLNFKLIKEIVNYVAKYHPKFKLSFLIATNGSLLSKEIVEFCVLNNIRLHISIDGPEEINDKYRNDINGNKTFDKVFSKIKFIKNNYPDYFNVFVAFLVTYNPSESMKDVIEFFKKNSDFFPVSNIIISSLIEDEEFYDYDKIPDNMKYLNSITQKTIDIIVDMRNRNESQGDYSPLNEKSSEMKYENKIAYILLVNTLNYITRTLNKQMIENNKVYPQGCCIPGRESLFVTSKGEYHYCEKMSHHTNNIGDVDKGINLEYVKDIIQEYQNLVLKDCRNCWAISICNQCFIQVYDGEKFNYELFRESCENLKTRLQKNLTQYCEIMEKDEGFFNDSSGLVK